MPNIAANTKEMAQFARQWRRGNELFKKAFEEQSLDPETHVHSYLPKKVEDPNIAGLISKCNVKEIVTFINYEATPKEAQKAKFQAIFCLGQTALEQDEKDRNAAQLLTSVAKRKET